MDNHDICSKKIEKDVLKKLIILNKKREGEKQ